MWVSFTTGCVSWLALLSSLSIGVHSIQNGDLIFTHVVFRHGTRAPTSFYPTDPNRNASAWSNGAGQLTNTGKRQQFALGQWLRKRYSSYLPDEYRQSDFMMQSLNMPRTLMAAQLTLAGLYPPVGQQVWMHNMHWQPIPVHVAPKRQGYLLGSPWCNDPVFKRLLLEALKSPHVTRMMKNQSDLIDYVNKWAGFQPKGAWSTISNIETMRNNLRITREYNLAIPEWAEPLYMHQGIEEIALLKYLMPVQTRQLTTYSVGYLLKAILDRCQSKFDGTLKPDRLMWAYSVREINLIMLMHVLGVFDNSRPLFAATLLFELRSDADGDPCLQVFYKRSGDHEHCEPLRIPRCGYQCKLRTMYAMFGSILPSDDGRSPRYTPPVLFDDY